jgi:hypothetical protein
MCGGRPQHHIEEEKRRAGGIAAAQAHQAELDRRAQADRMRQMQEQAMKAQEALLQQVAASMKQPVRTRTQEAAGTPLMRTQQKTAATRRGVASLRIARTPGINVSGGQTGINLG